MKKTISFLLAICMIASFFAGATPIKAKAAGEVIITDAATLQEKLSRGSESVLTLSENLLLDSTISIPQGRTVTIQGKAGSHPVIKPKDDWPQGTALFNISSGATVDFKNLALDGTTGAGSAAEKRARGIVVEEGGATLTLESVSIVIIPAQTRAARVCAYMGQERKRAF